MGYFYVETKEITILLLMSINRKIAYGVTCAVLVPQKYLTWDAKIKQKTY